MAYPFCNSTKELEDTEAPGAFSLYLLENEKMLNFLFEIIMHLFQRITSSKGKKILSNREAFYVAKTGLHPSVSP